MIVKSSQRKNPRQLAEHLTSYENDSVTITRISGLASHGSVKKCLDEMAAIAKASQCTNFLYHVSISPSPDIATPMTEQEWKTSWAVHDQAHGITSDYPYIEIEHQKNGRTHRHRVYLRVNPNTQRSLNLPFTKIKNERIARVLEITLGHPIVSGTFDKKIVSQLKNEGLHDLADKLEQSADHAPPVCLLTHKEYQHGKRTGKDPKTTHKVAATCYQQASDPDNFSSLLQANHLYMAKGEKCPVLVDKDGMVLPLLRSIKAGLKLMNRPSIRKAQLYAKIPDRLPTLEEAQKFIQQHYSQKPIPNTQNKKLNEALKKRQAGILEQLPSTRATHKDSFHQPSREPEQDDFWIRYRRKLLLEFYTKTPPFHLVSFWKITLLPEGWLYYTNKAGTIIDKGNRISSYMDNHKLAVKTMLDIGQAKGWKKIRVIGPIDFLTESFSQMQQRGISAIFNNTDEECLWEHLKKQSFSNVHTFSH